MVDGADAPAGGGADGVREPAGRTSLLDLEDDPTSSTSYAARTSVADAPTNLIHEKLRQARVSDESGAPFTSRSSHEGGGSMADAGSPRVDRPDSAPHGRRGEKYSVFAYAYMDDG